MANNTRDETVKLKYEAEGASSVDQLSKSIGDVIEKSLGTETAFGFLKRHLEELTVAALALETALKGIEFGKESLKNAEDVERSLSRVRALAGEAAGAFGEMDDAVEKAARAVNVSSQESASGLASLVSNGLSAKDAIDALIPTLQLAKIANVDVGTAAGLVADALKEFNLPATEAQHVVDLLTAASHGAAGGLAAMAAAAKGLAPDARAIGLDFDDLVGVLGLLTSKGFDVEKSVRGLRTVFQELHDPSSKLRGELKVLGDSTDDFGQAVAALTSGTPRANEALLHLSGGARTVIEALGQAGPEAIAKFKEALEQQNGVAAEATRLLDENLGGASTRFSLAIENIGRQLAKPVLEPFKDELEKLAGELNKFADSPDFKDIEKEVGEMAKNAAAALDKFLHGLDWKKFLADGKDAIGGIAKGLKELADSANTIATAINKTFDLIGGGYHAVVGGTQLVVAGAAKAADALVSTTKAAQSTHDALRAVADVASEQAAPHIQALHDDLVDLTSGTKEAAAAAESAAPAIESQGEASGKAAESTQQLGQSLGLVPDYLSKTGDAAATAAHSLGTLGDQASRIGGGPLQDARKALADATHALSDLIREGNATPAAMQAAERGVHVAAKALDDLKRSLDGAKASTGSFTDEMRKIGVTSQQALEEAADSAKDLYEKVQAASDGSVRAIADVQNVFLAYAQKRLAAAAQLDAGTRQSIEADLEAKAAVLDVSGALKDLETQSAKSQSALVSDANRAAAALGNEAAAARNAGQEVGAAANAAQSAFQGVTQATDDASGAAREYAADGGESLARVDDALANTRAGFLSLSEAAAKAFDANLVSEWGLAFDSTGAGFGRFTDALNKAAADTQRQINDQRKMLDSWIGELESGTAQSAQELQGLADEVKSGVVPALNLLGQQDLSRLLAALDAAKAKAEAAEQAAKAAKDSFDSLAESALDDLLQEEGNNNALEERRHRKKLKDLQEAADKAGELNSKEYLEAVANENRLHKLKMDHIKEQQDAQNNKDGKSGDGGAAGFGTPVNGGGGSGGNGIGGGAAALHPVTINLGDLSSQVHVSPGELDAFSNMLEALARAKGNSI